MRSSLFVSAFKKWVARENQSQLPDILDTIDPRFNGLRFKEPRFNRTRFTGESLFEEQKTTDQILAKISFLTPVLRDRKPRYVVSGIFQKKFQKRRNLIRCGNYNIT